VCRKEEFGWSAVKRWISINKDCAHRITLSLQHVLRKVAIVARVVFEGGLAKIMPLTVSCTYLRIQTFDLLRNVTLPTDTAL
jgi:hypothetical protein